MKIKALPEEGCEWIDCTQPCLPATVWYNLAPVCNPTVQVMSKAVLALSVEESEPESFLIKEKRRGLSDKIVE